MRTGCGAVAVCLAAGAVVAAGGGGDAPAAEVRLGRLEAHVRALSGVRHAVADYEELEKRGEYIEKALSASGLTVESRKVVYNGRTYRNIVGVLQGSDPARPRLLLGAHYDGFRGTPGADDNASGVAAMLEAAQALAVQPLKTTVEFVAFTLEERQHRPVDLIRRGSKAYASDARKRGVAYEAAIILECVGFTSSRQKGGMLARALGIRSREQGDFLAVVADTRSAAVMDSFLRSAATVAPGLPVVPAKLVLSGYLLPEARLSDHSSFWENGYPALMLTDTAMLRNPNYHRKTDTPETLDYHFLGEVTRGVVGFVRDTASR
ncbi:MAG TPA: M20/M25/M40 family metallo-hydrolase [Verrucomicrobiae bacterium]|nr:M20/M25/M40 family metallo-hydrolase [Verrucomicrobiae bacterium]